MSCIDCNYSVDKKGRLFCDFHDDVISDSSEVCLNLDLTRVMKNGSDYCEGFICKDVHRCISPNEKDCSENCDWYCNCQACRYDYDAETEQCFEKKSIEELMENGR